ncbi:MAG: DMT family transporter [Oligoflexia bacterium]|nr:DMT family transporter [Oligoflexia bacterium]
MNSAGPIFAFLASVTWAIGSVGYSKLSRVHSAFSVNFTRALVALPLFVAAVFVTAGGWDEGLREFAALRASHIGWFTLSMFASYGFGDSLFFWSSHYLGVPGALAIASSYPLWTALAGFLFRGEQLSVVQALGLVVTISGVLVVILSGARERGVEKGLLRGVALAFLTSLFWATNNFAASQGGQDVSAAVGNSVRMVVALGISFAIGKLFLFQRAIRLPSREIGRWLWLFALEAFLGSYFFMYGVSHSPLAIAATLTSLAPVISVPVAWLIGAERFSLLRTTGVCLVVLGIWALLGGF